MVWSARDQIYTSYRLIEMKNMAPLGECGDLYAFPSVIHPQLFHPSPRRSFVFLQDFRANLIILC
jgi:hypothetical protein